MQREIGGMPEWTMSAWPRGIPKIGSHREQRKREPKKANRIVEVLPSVAALLGFAGVAVYAMLSVTYDAFYRPLGIDPSDVGLTYTELLARSTGYIILLLMLCIAGIAVSGFWNLLRFRSLRRMKWRVVRATAIPLLIIYLGLNTYTNVDRANIAATAVKTGSVVTPSGRFFTILAFRADPVSIEPIDKSSSTMVAERFGCDPTKNRDSCKEHLTYLGKANGILVLYDVGHQRSIYLPASSVMLHLSNCRTKRSQDAACQQRFRYTDPVTDWIFQR